MVSIFSKCIIGEECRRTQSGFSPFGGCHLRPHYFNSEDARTPCALPSTRATPSVHSWKLHSVAGREILVGWLGVEGGGSWWGRKVLRPTVLLQHPQTSMLCNMQTDFFHFHWGCCGSPPPLHHPLSLPLLVACLRQTQHPSPLQPLF